MYPVIRSTLFLIALAGPAAAADSKPAALTPKEAADGWVQLFDGETTFGLKVEGEAVVKYGVLVVGGTKPTTITTTSSFVAPTISYEVATPDGKPAAGGKLFVPQFPHSPLTLHGVDQAKGNWGGVAGAATAAGPVRLEIPAGTVIQVSRLAARPSGLEPLFNGKDLTGWTVFQDAKRQRARYTVTPAGELHVLGGPGDLQTTAKFADFVLQTELKTNGPMVNSGLFFRCVPGQYQNGYEVQIQNGFKDGDRTKPTDGGTGAIYRRFPARKVVPNDREWFTLTIIATGPHIATWVNGYPTADWTDTRKPHENPRQGLRTEAGHISIQGHNPPMSADVLFRNMRIAELKAK